MDDNCSAVRAYNVYPVQRKMCVLLVLWTLWGNKRRCSTWFCVLLWFWPSGKTWYHVACECEHLRNVKPSILCSLSDIGKQLNTASLVHVQGLSPSPLPVSHPPCSPLLLPLVSPISSLVRCSLRWGQSCCWAGAALLLRPQLHVDAACQCQ